MNLFGKTFKTAFLFIIFAELLSLFGYLLPDFNKAAFFVIVSLTLILSLYKLEYGIWIILAELFIGSKGYLFFFEYNGLIVSIRIALWLIVMAVWLGKAIVGFKNGAKGGPIAIKAVRPLHGLEFFKSSYFSYFFILFIFILWGVVNGVLNNNEFSNIFFDFNGWLYFALVFPVYGVFADNNAADASGRDAEAERRQSVRSALQIFTAAIVWLSAKTFFLLFIFSHNMDSVVSEVYRWTRVSGLGEITQMQGGFYRVFFQSHIFVLAGFFIFLIIAVNQITNYKLQITNKSKIQNPKIFTFRFLLLPLLFSAILITFSRSFWVGLAFGLFFCFFILLFYYGIGWKKLLKILVVLAACGVAGIALIAAIVKFPYPSPTGGFSTSELLSERASKIKGEAAVSSRWALLPKLWDKIKEAPITGQGFGATITYQSSDPRVLETSPTGEYTTYAFEWGWLDIWLKLGLFGMLAYSVLIGKIISDFRFKILDLRLPEQRITLGATVGLAVIAVVSIFSPYMNHPLGIGYLILVSAILENFKIKK